MRCAAVTGSNNITLGAYSLKCLSSGSKNIAIGTYALEKCTTSGSCNIAIGEKAARCITGSCNIAIGCIAMRALGGGSGNDNIALGNYTMSLSLIHI